MVARIAIFKIGYCQVNSAMVRHGLSQDIQTWLPYCPYYAAASEILSRRWAATVLRALIPGPARFGEIASAIPDMTNKLLSQRLKDL